MKGAQSAWALWILSQSHIIVSAHAHPHPFLDELPVPTFPLPPLPTFPLPELPSPLEVLGGRKGALLGAAATQSTSSSSSSASTSPSTPSTTTSQLSTSTLDITFPTRSSSVNSSISSAQTSTSESSKSASSTTSTVPVNGVGPSGQNPSNMSDSTEQMSSQRRTLIIVLSTVLGSVGLILIVAALLLACRYRRGKAPFRNRGVTPINDDEIESWRGTVLEQKQSPKPEARPTNTPRGVSIDSIALKHSPQWSWTGSPNAISSLNSPGSMPEPPSFVARMPNSRIGLTDEAIPGADAFVPPVKRQSSRLSKAPPGHGRTKSRRSSISTKSIRSYNSGPLGDSKPKDRIPTWYDPDNESVGTNLRDTDHTNSSPGTSIFDGLASGGLSPRPKSKSQLRPWDNPQDIGRAIA